MISIVILTKNPGSRIKDVLQAVFDQKIDEEYELIIIDSGTTDGCLDFLEKSPARLIKINPSDFGHGKTRNFAVNFAKGEYIVMLVQDAIPTSDNWLDELIRPLREDENVAGVYSRQIPYIDANIMEKCFLSIHYPGTYQIRKNKEVLRVKDVFFSNVSSAMRRDLLLKFRFHEDLIMSEDQAWAKEVIQNGYKIVYNPSSVVYHSHKYSLIKVFQRFFDSGVSLKNLDLNAGDYKTGLKILYNEFQYCLKELGVMKFFLFLPYLKIYEFMRISGFLLGQNYTSLPLFLIKRFSLHKYYWEAIENKYKAQ